MEHDKTIASAVLLGADANEKKIGGRQVREAYADLKQRIAAKFSEDADAAGALTVMEQYPGDLETRADLERALTAVNVSEDRELVERAAAFLKLLEHFKDQLSAGQDVSKKTGGIRAGRIKAKNVTVGAHIEGGDPKDIKGVVEAASGLAAGGIDADEIEAENITDGLRYIADPADTSREEIRKEIRALLQNVDAAIAEGEIPDEGDAEYVKTSLETAEKELASPEPKPSLVARSLKNAKEILDDTAKALEAGGKVQAGVIKLAPTAGLIYGVVKTFFGI